MVPPVLGRLLWIAAAWVACVVLHNLIDGLLRQYSGSNGAEVFFLLLAVVAIPLDFVVSLVYTVVQLVRHRGS